MFASFTTEDDDFVHLISYITFTSATHAQTNFVLFRIINDNVVEPPEVFFISVGAVTATITITDDDGELIDYNTK